MCSHTHVTYTHAYAHTDTICKLASCEIFQKLQINVILTLTKLFELNKHNFEDKLSMFRKI